MKSSLPFCGVLAAAILLAPQTVPGQQIGYVEQFALAKDRETALQQLIPGTEDYYYYHCLHWLNQQQYEKVEQTLQAWIKRYKYTPRVYEILNRRALLTFGQTPEKTVTHLRQRMKLRFDHQKETIGKVPQLPTTLDQKRISREALTGRAFESYSNLNGFEDSALFWLAGKQLNADRRRDLLRRLRSPDAAGLVDLVLADLKHRNSGGFGSHPIHAALTIEQLEACQAKNRDLLNQSKFVNIYLSKLVPSADVAWRTNPGLKSRYLERLRNFVDRLGPVHNSLKAHVLYHQLLLDRSQNWRNLNNFERYLQLPRTASYANPKYSERAALRPYRVNLRANYEAITGLPPIGNDEPLIRSYLHKLLVDADDYKAYADYLSDTYLKQVFAETKVLNGLGDAERWASMLTPSQFQALKERVEIEFASSIRPRFRSQDDISLELFVKNVKTLIVKTYEINAVNYYRDQGQHVSSNISLDGLVANHEQTYKYTDSPLRRIKRKFEFPHIKKSGVYVIDFIGNGSSSRAVIHKGVLNYVSRMTTAGHVITVLKEGTSPEKSASLWLGGRQYKADKQGRILVPYSKKPGRYPIVLSNDSFSSLDHFQWHNEQYQFQAGLYVDRESLIQGNTAKLGITSWPIPEWHASHIVDPGERQAAV